MPMSGFTLFVFCIYLPIIIVVIVLNGLFIECTGHFLLRLFGVSGYDSILQTSMKIGATGGAILCPALIAVVCIYAYIFGPSLNTRDAPPVPYWKQVLDIIVLDHCGLAAFGAAVGAVGSKVLISHGHKVMDPLHAAKAGAVGGAFIKPGIGYGLLLILTLIPLIISLLPCEVGCWNIRNFSEQVGSSSSNYNLPWNSTSSFASVTSRIQDFRENLFPNYQSVNREPSGGVYLA
ncbi:hypothetical protein M408DRAFT_334120 [Serendipita vermifera MAFF 305830]|uniref:Uncharacterized protein n=1 Tax=Serendipita vermifera MAFF 305830 TaxID=933852 RepID=A0A0C3A686_SERVB|nr:hypothetical protein M408DRAFT_334120 [Serendipita vermifera MAFF 305830]